MSNINSINIEENTPVISITTIEDELLTEEEKTPELSIQAFQNKLINVSTIHLDKYLLFQDKEEVKKIIILLTNNSDCVKDIVRIVELIMEDGKIDINDAPLLLAFIKKIISSKSLDLNISKNISSENFIDIIKCVLVILTKENILKIPDQEEFITEISKLLDSLKIVGDINNTVNTCFSWISKLSCITKN